MSYESTAGVLDSYWHYVFMRFMANAPLFFGGPLYTQFLTIGLEKSWALNAELAIKLVN